MIRHKPDSLYLNSLLVVGDVGEVVRLSGLCRNRCRTLSLNVAIDNNFGQIGVEKYSSQNLKNFDSKAVFGRGWMKRQIHP